MKKAEVQMIEKKKNNKNQMYTFFVMLMFAVIICSNFFRMHFSQDTYCINDNKNTYGKQEESGGERAGPFTDRNLVSLGSV